MQPAARGGVARRLTGVGRSGDSERGLAWDLVQKRVLDMCNPPVRSEQWIGARGVVLDGDGGVERRNIAGVRRAGN